MRYRTGGFFSNKYLIIFFGLIKTFFFNVIIVKRFIGVEKISGIKGMVNYVYTCSTKGKTLVRRDKKQDFYLFFFVLVFFYLFFFYQSFCEFLPLDQLNSVNFLAPSGTESD